MLSKQGGPNEDDAMFTKRPFGQVSCASCQKNIVNLQGLAQQHVSWNKLPFKEPSKRLADYGAGFSKMLQSVRNDNFAHHHSQSFEFSHLDSSREIKNQSREPSPTNKGRNKKQLELDDALNYSKNHYSTQSQIISPKVDNLQQTDPNY